MKLSVYLHDYIVNIITCFGTLDEVTNKLLDAYEEGIINIEYLPTCPYRGDCRRYEINVENENYINLILTYGATSPRYSLRRLLYWFVDNEIYNELEFEKVSVSRFNDNYNMKLQAIINKLEKLTRICNKTEKEQILSTINTLRRLKRD